MILLRPIQGSTPKTPATVLSPKIVYQKNNENCDGGPIFWQDGYENKKNARQSLDLRTYPDNLLKEICFDSRTPIRCKFQLQKNNSLAHDI